jgi:hypothetical protein
LLASGPRLIAEWIDDARNKAREFQNMNAAQQQYRACFASFLGDLQGLVDVAIRAAGAAELERLTASQKRQQRSAARSTRRRATPSDNGTPRRAEQPRGRTKKKPANGGLAAGSSEQTPPVKPVAPPPLFVHKRSRDGQIQHLSRRDDGDSPAQRSVAG